ncbi:MAG: type IX secretion system membrane protein PorP/SprF [Saprospiraceae bacterium]|nr:type IX secretion system membrane protein PorP/SprF [Saprospiraceae bacterium]
MKILIAILCCLSYFNLSSQQLSISYFNNNNPELFNPSAWNTDILKYRIKTSNQLFAYYRSQWTGLDLGPKYLGAHYSHLSKYNTIIGLGIKQESFGPYTYSNLSSQYAFRIEFKNNAFISAGGKASINFYTYNPNKIKITDPDDPIAESNENYIGASFSPGIFYTKSYKNDITLSVGASYDNWINLLFISNENQVISKSYLIHGSLIKFLTTGYDRLSYYELSFIYRQWYKLTNDINLSFKYQWKGYLSIRPGIRFGTIEDFNLHSFHFDIGLPISNLFQKNKFGIDINYSSDFPLQKNVSQFGLSHELSIGWLF